MLRVGSSSKRKVAVQTYSTMRAVGLVVVAVRTDDPWEG